MKLIYLFLFSYSLLFSYTTPPPEGECYNPDSSSVISQFCGIPENYTDGTPQFVGTNYYYIVTYEGFGQQTCSTDNELIKAIQTFYGSDSSSSVDCEDGSPQAPEYPEKTSEETYPDGSKGYNYDDDSYQHCNASLQTCFTMDKDGNRIPNIPVDHDNDSETPPVTYASPDDALAMRLLYAGGLALTIGTGGSLGVLAGLGSTLGSAVATTGILSGLGITSTAFDYVPFTANSTSNDNVSSTSNALRIDLLDTSSAPSVSTSVDANSNPVLTTTNANNEQVRVTSTTNNIEVETTASNGTKTTVTVPNTTLTTPTTSNDFSEDNNLDQFAYTTVTTTPTVINYDGTTTSGVTTSTTSTHNPSNSTSSTSSTSSTTPTTSTSSVSTSSVSTGTTTSSNSVTTTSSQDLTPITSRLDQMIRQNTLTNDTLKGSKDDTKKQLEDLLTKADTRNETLTDISEAIDAQNDSNSTTNTLLNAIKEILESQDNNSTNDTNSTDTLLEDIKGLIESQNDNNSTNELLTDITDLLESQSDANSTTNSLLEGISGLLDDMKSDANQTSADANKTNAQNTLDLKGILEATENNGDKLQEMLDGDEDDNGVKDALQSALDEFSQAYTNLKGSYDNIENQFSDLNATLKGGFTNNLPTAKVTTCPFNNYITFGDSSIPVNIDICKVISPYYSTLYFIFYMMFFVAFMSVIFNVILTMRSN